MFRTCTGILDLLCVFLIAAHRKLHGRYPSHRFEGPTLCAMIIHIVVGMVLLYGGTYLHFSNEVNPVSEIEDETFYRQVFYNIYGAFGVSQALAVFLVITEVRGEKRITIPVYFGAGIVNLVNAIQLILNPSLKSAFLLYGSVNAFIFVRAYLVLLAFSHIDSELLYTYAALAAGATTYPLAAQNPWVFCVLASPVVYTPFHEKFCQWFSFLGFTLEDTAMGNQPAEKNVSPLTVMLRTKVIDKGYAKKLEALKTAKVASGDITNQEETGVSLSELGEGEYASSPAEDTAVMETFEC